MQYHHAINYLETKRISNFVIMNLAALVHSYEQDNGGRFREEPSTKGQHEELQTADDDASSSVPSPPCFPPQAPSDFMTNVHLRIYRQHTPSQPITRKRMPSLTPSQYNRECEELTLPSTPRADNTTRKMVSKVLNISNHKRCPPELGLSNFSNHNTEFVVVNEYLI